MRIPKQRQKLTEFQLFRFFTLLMFAAASLLFVFACFYKGRTHFQSQEPGINGPPESRPSSGCPTTSRG